MKLFATFYNRDFTNRVQPDFNTSVVNYSHSALGGPRAAQINIAGGETTLWTLVEMLRCPIEISNEKGEYLWWGYINDVSLMLKNYTLAVDLTYMANAVKVLYGIGEATTWLSDTQSTDEYGTKEIILTVSSPTAGWANQHRQTYLNSNRYPQVDRQPYSSGQMSAVVNCRGWWSTLDWRYPEVASGSAVDTASQITTIISTYGEFLQGSTTYGTGRTELIRPDSGVTSNPYQNGYNTARYIVEEICRTGTTDGVRMLPTVMPARVVTLTVEPTTTSGSTFLINAEGELMTPQGDYIRPELCTCGVLVSMADLIPSSVDVSKLSNFPYVFIEETEYSVMTGKAVYTPRGIMNLWEITEVRNG